MSKLINLPMLKIKHDNFPSSMLCVANRIFVIYVVNTKVPFWVVSLDADYAPEGPAQQFSDHLEAIDYLRNMAASWLE